MFLLDIAGLNSLGDCVITVLIGVSDICALEVANTYLDASLELAHASLNSFAFSCKSSQVCHSKLQVGVLLGRPLSLSIS